MPRVFLRGSNTRGIAEAVGGKGSHVTNFLILAVYISQLLCGPSAIPCTSHFHRPNHFVTRPILGSFSHFLIKKTLRPSIPSPCRLDMGKRKERSIPPSEPERKMARTTKTSADGGNTADVNDQSSNPRQNSSAPQSRQLSLFDRLQEMAQTRQAKLLDLFPPLRPPCQKTLPMVGTELLHMPFASPIHPTLTSMGMPRSLADPATKENDASNQEIQDSAGSFAISSKISDPASDLATSMWIPTSLADPATKENDISNREIQDAASSLPISNKASGPASDLDVKHEEINIFVLLARHGGKATACRHPGPWSHSENWVLSSVGPDGAPWASKLSDHSTACMFVKELSFIQKEGARMKLSQIMEDAKGAYQKLIKEHWQSYEQTRFLEWERRGVLAVERELTALNSNCEPRPVQMLMWQNNSCAVDAMLTVLPRVALNAHAKGLYKDDDLVASPAATIIAGLQLCERTTENQELGSHQAISNWIRHLAADLARYKGSKSDFWSVFEESQAYLDIVDKMTLDFPILLGNSRSAGPEAFVSVKVHILSLDVLDDKIQWTKNLNKGLSCTDLLLSSFPAGKLIRNGIHVVGLPDTSGYKDRRAMSKALTSGWRTVTESAPGNETRHEIEFLAVVGYKNGRRDHFISGITVVHKNDEFLFVHDGISNNGSQTRITVQQAFYRSDQRKCALFDVSQSFLVFSVWEHR
jgi:hypothetical protein